MPKGQYDRSKAKSHIEPGENSRMVTNALLGFKKPRVDTKDTQAIAERIEDYLRFCIENDVAPSVAGCANWLGVVVQTLESWYTGLRGSPEHQRIASNFYGVLQDIWAQKMDTGNINPVSGIFMSKAFFGYKDTQEIVIQNTVKQELSVSDLIAESKRLPGAENMGLPNPITPTIDADYRVLENDKRYERAAERAERAAERKAASIADKPRQKAAKKEYLKEYYKEHKAEQLARNEKSKAKAKARKAAEQAQKGDPEQITLDLTLNQD